MSKQELIGELQSWLADPEFSPDRSRIDDIQARYETLRQASETGQLEKFQSEGGTQDDFVYKREAEDIRFDELLDIYRDKRKKAEKLKADEQESNYKEKSALITELQELIQDEENIGKAYKRFNAIKQKWNEIGPVPVDKRRELQADYSRLIELFYYNIHIYRELQINDLKKNLELKQEVIGNIKTLENEKSINQVDFLIHKYLDDWDQIGPTFKEEWEKIREEFKEAVNGVFERIREHRKSVKEDHHNNYEKKKELVARVREIADKELTDVKEVQKLTKQVIDTQKDWKHIGYAGRGKNDSIWTEFRAACDAYFEKRSAFLEVSGKAFSSVKEKKRALIDKAKEIYTGEDLETIANQLKGLQREWKQAGKLLPQEEYKLFREFRKYCDDFFERKKQSGEKLAAALTENLQKKEELLANFAQELESGIKEKGEDLISEWKSKWTSVGEVPSKISGKVEKAFSSLLSRAYKSLGVSSAELEEKEFSNKIELITNREDAEDMLQNEIQFVKRKIKEAEGTVLQLENKLDFFTYSDDSNPLKRDLLRRIEDAKGEVAQWKEKKKRIDLTAKELRNREMSVSGDGSQETTGEGEG